MTPIEDTQASLCSPPPSSSATADWRYRCYASTKINIDESLALRKAEVEKNLADQEKTSKGSIARDRATLEQEREIYNEHVWRRMDKRSSEIGEENSTLQKALQDHQGLEEAKELAHLVFAFESVESQSWTEHNLLMELQNKLDTMTVELGRLSSQKQQA